METTGHVYQISLAEQSGSMQLADFNPLTARGSLGRRSPHCWAVTPDSSLQARAEGRTGPMRTGTAVRIRREALKMLARNARLVRGDVVRVCLPTVYHDWRRDS
jgi:hypothetical protein